MFWFRNEAYAAKPKAYKRKYSIARSQVSLIEIKVNFIQRGENNSVHREY